MTTMSNNMDDIYEIVMSLVEDYCCDPSLDAAKGIMSESAKKNDWLNASYILVCTWDNSNSGGYELPINVSPINSELDGLIESMQRVIDNAGGDWGIYDHKLIDIETGTSYSPQISAIELV